MASPINTLQSSRLFAELSPAELERLRSGLSERHYHAGQEIFRAGDRSDHVYLVREGVVELEAVLGNGERRVLGRLGAGEVFGEMAVLEDEPRSAGASAIADAVIWCIPRDRFIAVLERHPRMTRALLREMSRHLRDVNHLHVRELIQAEQWALVGRFARSVVHDLKGPLGIIGLSADMLISEAATEEARKTARDRIMRQIGRITGMIDDMVELTRTAERTVFSAPMDYRKFMHEFIEDVRPELELRSVALKLENEPPEMNVSLSPPHLTRVFLNLFNNAAEAMPMGGTIVLRFFRQSGEIVTEIEDNGPGIPMELADRLFEPFATFGKPTGTGLGLSICKKIVEEHGGRIHWRRQQGRGAIFGFTLPVGDEASAIGRTQ